MEPGGQAHHTAGRAKERKQGEAVAYAGVGLFGARDVRDQADQDERQQRARAGPGRVRPEPVVALESS